jgi:hypothetical protein
VEGKRINVSWTHDRCDSLLLVGAKGKRKTWPPSLHTTQWAREPTKPTNFVFLDNEQSKWHTRAGVRAKHSWAEPTVRSLQRNGRSVARVRYRVVPLFLGLLKNSYDLLPWFLEGPVTKQNLVWTLHEWPSRTANINISIPYCPWATSVLPRPSLTPTPLSRKKELHN